MCSPDNNVNLNTLFNLLMGMSYFLTVGADLFVRPFIDLGAGRHAGPPLHQGSIIVGTAIFPPLRSNRTHRQLQRKYDGRSYWLVQHSNIELV